MNDTTWIIDSESGELTVEGLQQSELKRLFGDLLPSGNQVNCARPINTPPLANSIVHISNDEPSLRVFRIYHNSVVEGPGRRSVAEFAGCLHRCSGFIYSLEWAKYDAAHERHNQRTTHTRLLVLV
ncbi:MAG: hypothetical protein MOB07_26665 [Acidobacteria bacterium]|nr:hypothetical protein [Acidobacteriota bacterium]